MSIAGSQLRLASITANRLDSSDAANFRAAFDLEPGTDVQAYDASLTSLAALATAADKIAYTTAADTWAEAAITAAGRAILDDADASAQRTTLGLAIGTDIYGKAAVDNLLQGLKVKVVDYSNEGSNYPATYANGAAGVGATLTNNLTMSVSTTNGSPVVSMADTQGLAVGMGVTSDGTALTGGTTIIDIADGTPEITLSTNVGATETPTFTFKSQIAVDGVSLSAADRVVFPSQTNAEENGIYVVTTPGSTTTNWVLTRSTDSDLAAEFVGQLVFVGKGTKNAGSRLLCSEAPAVIGTNDVVYTTLADPMNTYRAGDGIDLEFMEFAVDVSDFAGTGLEDDGSNNLRIAAAAAGVGLSGGAGSALAIDKGTKALAATGGETTLVLDATPGSFLQVYRNGVLLRNSVGADEGYFTIIADTITFGTVLIAGDYIWAEYFNS